MQEWKRFNQRWRCLSAHNIIHSLFERSRAANSVVGDVIWQKSKPIQAFMVVLGTCKNDEGPFNKRAKVALNRSPVDFHICLNKSMLNNWPPDQGHFWPYGFNLNRHGRGLLVDATYQNSTPLALVVLDKKVCSCFPYISLCKTCDPQGETIFSPRGKFWTNLVEVH